MRIAIVAGEASGDLLGAALIRAVRARFPEAQFAGIAGPKMIAEGARTLFPMEKLAVRGIVEVLKHVREILAIRRELTQKILAERPDVFIGIDSPDFCLPLEAKLKAAGIPTVHYVSPSVWAWRPERIQKIAHAVSRMLVLFPFEQAIYEKAGIPVSFVGHPLADAMPLDPDRDGARTQLRLARSGTTVALLPGSRLGELELHADLVIETARTMHAKRPDARFFVPLATRETREYFERRLYVLEARELPITILFGHASLALTSADVALVASGTATLEAALARCPMVVTYKLKPLTYRIVRKRALLPYFSLPNILSGEFIVPEILQDDATPGALAQALCNWLDHKEARQALKARFAEIHRSLCVGHETRVIEALMPYLCGHAPSADPQPPLSLRPAVRS
jgi:lipid-A-disaccharide synthase